MKVSIVCGAGYISGKEVMALELANGLRDASYDVDVVTTLWGDGEFGRRLKALNFPVHQMRLGYISATLTFNELRMTVDQIVHLPGLWLSYRRFLRKVAPEKIIHTNWQHLLLLLPFLRAERDLFWVHEILPDKAQYRKLFSILSRRLSSFAAVSHAVRRSLLKLGVPEDMVAVIHNGLSDFSEGHPLPHPSPAKVRIGIVGQIGPWKGHQDLLEAFAILSHEHTNCELHIFGSDKGHYADNLRKLAAQLKLNDTVRWHGFIPDRAQIYSEIDICVVPSRFEEPFGMVAVEAGMAGLPCVATRTGGLPEIIEDGVTGILIEAGNPVQLGKALDKLVKDPVLRFEMGRAARQRARSQFSRQRFVEEFARLLEKC